MPQSSQSDSTRVTVVPDTLVTTSPDTSSSQYPGSQAWQDSMAQAQTLEEGHDPAVIIADRVVKTAKTTWKALKFAAKKLGEWWNEDSKKQNYQGKIESADDDT